MSKTEELAILRELTEKITAGMDPAASFGSSGQDRLGNAVAKIVDLENDISRDTDTYEAQMREAWELMGQLKKPKHIKVLSKLYLQFKDWPVIGEEMGCTARNAQIIHGKALVKFAELMREKGMMESVTNETGR